MASSMNHQFQYHPDYNLVTMEPQPTDYNQYPNPMPMDPQLSFPPASQNDNFAYETTAIADYPSDGPFEPREPTLSKMTEFGTPLIIENSTPMQHQQQQQQQYEPFMRPPSFNLQQLQQLQQQQVSILSTIRTTMATPPDPCYYQKNNADLSNSVSPARVLPDWSTSQGSPYSYPYRQHVIDPVVSPFAVAEGGETPTAEQGWLVEQPTNTQLMNMPVLRAPTTSRYPHAFPQALMVNATSSTGGGMLRHLQHAQAISNTYRFPSTTANNVFSADLTTTTPTTTKNHTCPILIPGKFEFKTTPKMAVSPSPLSSISQKSALPFQVAPLRPTTSSRLGGAGDDVLRPLSAYNFFFSDERERILVQNNQSTKDACATLIARHEKEESLEERKQRLLKQHLQKDRSKRRPHRKTHGKITFTTLSKLIGQRWRQLDESEKNFYKVVAATDLQRYQDEIAKKHLVF
jgi:hypothetical protein